jgi:penicillin-binding protein 1C
MDRRTRRLVALSAVGAVAAAACLLVFVHGLRRDLPAPAPSKLVLDRRGSFLTELPGDGQRLGFWPPPRDLPARVRVATLETEDRRFYEHPGVNARSLLRAAAQNLRHGRVISGASTIAMQVARMRSPGPRTFVRKLREAAEALLLIRDHGHERVLRHYLTVAPYGNRVHGVQRAARYYFDKPVEDLSWLQAAFLAGLPQAPGRMDPHEPAGLRRGLARARRILGDLHRRGHLGPEEYAEALGSALGLVPRPARRPAALHAALGWAERAAGRPGLLQHASLDLDAQEKVAEVLQAHLQKLRKLGAGNAAALVVDRLTGEVLAQVGSLDYFAEDAHGAIDYSRARRPPGSALKPFLYALALERGQATAASEFADVRLEFERGRGAPYRPENISHTFLGPMLLRDALGNSRNIPALQALARVGVEPSLAFFAAAGVAGVDFAPERYGLGLALGNLHVTLEELVDLYGLLANQGRRLPRRHFLDEPGGSGPRLLSAGTAQLVTHILADPVARQPSFPAGSALDFDYATAIKTGTSQGYRDAWAVAFTDRLLVGVWVGNHDWRRMNRVGGLLGAARPLHAILDRLMPAHRPHRRVLESFPPPEGFHARTVCALSGRLAGPDCPHRRQEHFAPGSEPVEVCGFHGRVAVDRRNGLRAGPDCPAEFVTRRAMVDLPERYARWAREARLEVAPTRWSPLCGPPAGASGEAQVVVAEPRDGARYRWDPATPAEFSTVLLAARVRPEEEPVVWLVDGLPVARVDYPHETRWSLEPGAHVIQAALLHRGEVSPPVRIEVVR